MAGHAQLRFRGIFGGGSSRERIYSSIWTRPDAPADRASLAIIPAVTIPVRTKDFSQSAVEGPRIFPSM